MKITKFSSQLFEQVTVNVRRALKGLAEWGKTVPEKTRRLQESYRTSDLRKIFTGSLDAIAVTTQKITKFRPQLVAALEHVPAHVRRALNRLGEWGKTVPEKTRRLQESYRTSDLRKIFTGSLDAIAVTTQKITKFRPQLVAALEQVPAHVRRALNRLGEWGKTVPEKTRRLQESYRTSDLRKIFAGSLDAIAVTTHKITKFRPQLVAALEQVSARVRRALNGLAEWGKTLPEKTRRLQESYRASDLRKVFAGSLDAIAVTSHKISKFGSQLFVTLQHMTVHLRRTLNTLTGRWKNAREETRKLQEARRARESDLQELMASSVDAIVLTNADRRFVAANQRALHLFGVSETNIRHFTIDAFLLGQSRTLEGNGLPFISRAEKQGECQIRRLDGSLRLTEYMFVANFVPFRHLFRFRNERECAPRRRAAAA